MRQIRQQSILVSLSVVSDLTKKYLSFLAGDNKQQQSYCILSDEY